MPGCSRAVACSFTAAIARAIEQSFAHLAEAEPETLAYHLTEAGLLDKAADYWLRAGKIAVARYANLEAIAHLRRGIEALSGFADGASKDRLELDLQFALGPCFARRRGSALRRHCGNRHARSRALRAAG
jgi:predicted ATPase